MYICDLLTCDSNAVNVTTYLCELAVHWGITNFHAVFFWFLKICCVCNLAFAYRASEVEILMTDLERANQVHGFFLLVLYPDMYNF